MINLPYVFGFRRITNNHNNPIANSGPRQCVYQSLRVVNLHAYCLYAYCAEGLNILAGFACFALNEASELLNVSVNGRSILHSMTYTTPPRRTPPIIKLTTNMTRKMTKSIFAIPAAPAAMLPNSKSAATKANTRKVNAHYNMIYLQK